ncbi:MAG: hypothetical protein NT167_31345 [Verrucomicrobia bacterium]|nr:hypothetical protein [Verrucomicrobiota bacterium]
MKTATYSILLACLTFVGTGTLRADEKAPDKPAAKTGDEAKAEGFKQPKTLAELLALPPDQLDKVDVALINLLCAEGLRGSEILDTDYLTRTLNGWAAHVESETKRNYHLFEEHPEKFKNSLAYFRMAMLATVLVQDLRIQYNPEREKQLENGHILRSDNDEKAFFADSKDVFIHGLLGDKHYGTCASMPFLYVAIGRRLGYPVTLATTATHFYVRYEEGNGKHLNVEATEHRAFLTPSDDEYKNPWEMHLSDDEVKGMAYLQPLSNKQILGHSLLTRSAVLRSMKQYDKQAETWATAARYLPDTPLWKEIIHDMQLLAKNEGEQERREALWDRVAKLYVPHGAGYAYFQDKKVRLHLLMNYSADAAAIEKAIKTFENELREYVKPFIEPGDSRTITLGDGAQQQLVLRYTTVSGAEVKIPADYLPPFERRTIPPEVSQRVADKKLEDGESILAEFWTFYDEQAQARQRAMQSAERQRALQNGTGGSILVAREQVPLEYWEGIPPELEARLQGLNDPQKIVEEINAYYTQDYVRKHGRPPPDETIARQLAASPAYENVPPHIRNVLVSDPAFGYKRLNPPNDDEGRRRWLEEQNAASMREYLQRVNPSRSRIRTVPSSVLNGVQPSLTPPQNSPNSLLTPLPPLQENPKNGKGQP